MSRPDPSNPNKFIYKEVFKGITPILYNLQAVKKAIEEHRPIIIVEGEKDCETLAKSGFTATTCPMGAGKWRKEYSDMLIGATVYIIADNDDVGKSHAKSVAKSLFSKASEIFLTDIKRGASGTGKKSGAQSACSQSEHTEDVPSGFDISDRLEATPEESKVAVVSELMANSTEYKGEKENGIAVGSSGEKMTAAEQLVKLVEVSGVTFFHSDIKELYACIPVDEHKEIQPICSRDFELWLNGLSTKTQANPSAKTE